jgi:hypothetical protein
MTKDFFESLDGLPAWMIMFLLLSLILSPIILELIRGTRSKKRDEAIYGNFNKFTKQAKDLHEKLEMLTGIVYDRYSNDLTLDSATKTISKAYDSMALNIMNELLQILKEKRFTDRDKGLEGLEEKVRIVVSYDYHNKLSYLSKLKCKGIFLDFHLSGVDYEQIVELVTSNIQCNHAMYYSEWHEVYFEMMKCILSYFKVLKVQTTAKLEQLILIK